MTKYNVMITETLQLVVEVIAENQIEAEEIVKNNWSNSKYILDAGNFTGVQFKVVSDNI